MVCVSPRVNSAEPCERGKKCVSAKIGRICEVVRPSMRVPSLRIAPRTISASSFFISLPAAIWSCGLASVNATFAAARAAFSAFERADLSVSLYAAAISLPISFLSLSFAAERSACSAMAQGSFAACSASFMIALTTSLHASCANRTAPSMISSESSLASDSTIITAS